MVLAATHNPAAAGAVGASIQAPTLLLALWLGRRVDRHSRRLLLLTADLARAVCFAGLAWLAVGTISTIWPFVLIGLMIGTADSLHSIAGSAILPETARGKGLVRRRSGPVAAATRSWSRSDHATGDSYCRLRWISSPGRARALRTLNRFGARATMAPAVSTNSPTSPDVHSLRRAARKSAVCKASSGSRTGSR